LSEQISKELSHDVDVSVGFRQFVLDGLIEFVDDFAVDHHFLGSLHVPVLEQFEVLLFAVGTQFLDGLVLAFSLLHDLSNLINEIIIPF
jgi:hypothetical protein